MADNGVDFTELVALCVFVGVFCVAIWGVSGESNVLSSTHTNLVTQEDVAEWVTRWNHACLVQGVFEGDQVWCNDSTLVRLIGIDAPELGYGIPALASHQTLEQLMPLGTHATIELDEFQIDRYGRVHAYLYLPDGHMVNESMAEMGYAVARSHAPNRRYEQRLSRAAESARKEKRGLWQDPVFQCFAQYRTSHECRDTGS